MCLDMLDEPKNGGNSDQFIANIERSGVTSMYNMYLDLST